jgi:hypothetical protein
MHLQGAIMKRAVALSLFLSLVLVSPSFAILRPRYPVKPSAPDQGHWVIIGGDALKNPPQK